jgi:repressor LexA
MHTTASRRMGLTPQQSACLQAIRSHHGGTGAMPSISDLQTAMGMASRSAVHRLLVQLEVRGAIKRAAGRARAIRLTTVSCPHCGGELP